MKISFKPLMVFLAVGMLLSTGIGNIVSFDVNAKSNKSKKDRVPYQWDKLDLTKDQISKIAGILPKELAKLYIEREKARDAAGDDIKDAGKKKAIDKPFNKKIKPLRVDWEKKASSVLTKDQREKLAEIKSSKKKERKKKKK